MPHESAQLPAWASDEAVEAVARALLHDEYGFGPDHYDKISPVAQGIERRRARAALLAAAPYVERYADRLADEAQQDGYYDGLAVPAP